MKKIIYLILLVISIQLLYSQRVPKKVFDIAEKKSFVSLAYYSGRASAFYDLNGNFITSMWDSTTFVDTVTKLPIPREYIFEFQRYGIELGFNYNLTDKFNLTAEIPISSYSINERFVTKFIYDSLGYLKGNIPRQNKADFDRTRIDYFGIGANYAENSEDFIYGANVQVRIPSGFESGQFDSNDLFLSDGAFAFIVGAKVGYRINKLTLGLESDLYLRTEDFKNQLKSAFSLTFRGVEGTHIQGIIEHNKSLASFENTALLDYHREILQEDYLAVGVSFKMLFGENLTGEVDYRIRVLGTNSLNFNTFKIILGYEF